jgi:hypothetical protein
MNTIKNIDDFYDMMGKWEEVSEKAADIATAMLKLEGFTRAYFDSDDAKIENGDICFTYDDYHCGESDYHSVTVPPEYLFDDDWLVNAKEELRKRKEREANKERIRKENEAKRAEEAERKKYFELKAKFETDATAEMKAEMAGVIAKNMFG